MKTRVLACLALLPAAAPVRAGAPYYGVSFGGVINFVDPRVDDRTFEVGADVAGFFRIDASVADGEPAVGEASYDGAVRDLLVTFGAYSATASSGELFIRDGELNPDNFFVNVEPSGAQVAGLPLASASLSLVDTTRAVFADESIPTSVELADFDSARVSLSYMEGSSGFSVCATLTSLTYLPVPEPGAGVLTASGALALVALRGRVRGSRARPAA